MMQNEKNEKKWEKKDMGFEQKKGFEKETRKVLQYLESTSYLTIFVGCTEDQLLARVQKLSSGDDYVAKLGVRPVLSEVDQSGARFPINFGKTVNVTVSCRGQEASQASCHCQHQRLSKTKLLWQKRQRKENPGN
jgi:hypothetical protein